MKGIKKAIEAEWVKHGEVSSSQTVTKTESGTGKRARSSVEVVNEHRSPQVNLSTETVKPSLLNIDPSHHKMMIRNIVFCKWCGYNTRRNTQKLADECPKVPKHNDVTHKLRRMLLGKHPDRNQLEWPGGLSTKGTQHLVNLDGV